MSADPRLTAAREYLRHARKITFADLPEAAVLRMAAELRRQLGQVLDYVTEGEADSSAGQLALEAIQRIVDGGE